VLGIEFGEKSLYKVKTGSNFEKINSRWEWDFPGSEEEKWRIMGSNQGENYLCTHFEKDT